MVINIFPVLPLREALLVLPIKNRSYLLEKAGPVSAEIDGNAGGFYKPSNRPVKG